jgi:hypothetical protein
MVMRIGGAYVEMMRREKRRKSFIFDINLEILNQYLTITVLQKLCLLLVLDS